MAPSTQGWIDIHGHFYPKMTASQRDDRYKASHEGKFMVASPDVFDWTPKKTIAYLDKAGIAMQMISYIPKDVETLKASNDYGASVVAKYPSRFGLLAALPTDSPEACLAEIDRVEKDLHADGFAVTCHYKDVYLSDPSLDPVWEKLNQTKAVVFTHPDAYKPPTQGRPAPLIEVAFETTRTLVDMLYQGVFRRYPNITFITSHGGGALPLLADRLELLGTESWVPNPNNLTKDEVKRSLSKLYFDTAAVGPAALGPAIRLAGKQHIVYGADCGVPCSTDETMEENKNNVLAFEGMQEEERSAIGRNLYHLFPEAVKRLAQK